MTDTPGKTPPPRPEWLIEPWGAEWRVKRDGHLVARALPDFASAVAFVAKVMDCTHQLEAWLHREHGHADPDKSWSLEFFPDAAPATWRAVHQDNGQHYEMRTPELAEAVRCLVQFGGPEWAEALNIDPDWYASPDYDPRG